MRNARRPRCETPDAPFVMPGLVPGIHSSPPPPGIPRPSLAPGRLTRGRAWRVEGPEAAANNRRPPCALPLLIEARSDQYDAKNQGASAEHRRDDVRRVFGGLEFQVPELGHVLGLLGGEYGDREP